MDSINIVRLGDILPDLRQRQRTLEDAFVAIHKNDIAIQAIKNILQSLQETVHMLELEKQRKCAGSPLVPHEHAVFEAKLK